MSKILHLVLWQGRRGRDPLAVHALLWFGLTWFSWRDDDGTVSLFVGFRTLHFILLGFTAMLALDAAAADPAAGTDGFWRTRPPRWHTVLASQSLFAALFIAGPPMLCWL